MRGEGALGSEVGTHKGSPPGLLSQCERGWVAAGARHRVSSCLLTHPSTHIIHLPQDANDNTWIGKKKKND